MLLIFNHTQSFSTGRILHLKDLQKEYMMIYDNTLSRVEIQNSQKFIFNGHIN